MTMPSIHDTHSTFARTVLRGTALAGLAVAACLAAGGVASADEPRPGYVVLGAAHTIAPSGTLTSGVWTMECEPTNASDKQKPSYAPALIGLELGERIDKPLYRKTHCQNLNYNSNYTFFSAEWKRASPEDPASPTQSYAAVFPVSVVAHTDDFYVTGIKVCTNGNKDSQKAKVKGVELFGSRIDRATATVKTAASETTSISKKLANCTQWEPRKNCPANEIATGWKGYYSLSGIVGIALVCQPLTWKEGRLRPGT